MISLDDLRADVSADAVISAYGLRIARRGRWYRLRECPRCHEKSRREAIAIEAASGRWLHHGYERNAGGECSGDVFDLIAACEGLDTRRDFPRIVARAAEIAGVTPQSEECNDRQRKQRDTIATLEREEREARLAAKEMASDAWNELRGQDEREIGYLASRGLEIGALRDAVRPADDGIAVAIRDTDGAPINVARRLYAPTHAKVMTMRGCTTRGSMINAVSDIRSGSDVIVCEGVIDSLTARQAWPRAVVLGANGAGNVPKIVETAILHIRIAGARLLLCPHDDVPGHRSAIAAVGIAQAAGVEPELVEYTTNDLNDAWRAGWRPGVAA